VQIILDPWFWLLAIPAFLITGISKGGFGSGAGNTGVPLMSLVIPAPQAAAIALPVLCAMDLVALRAWWGKWDRARLLELVPGTILGLVLGTLAFGSLSDRAVKLLLGVVVLSFLARSLWLARRKGTPPPAEPNRAKATLWSAVSGFTSFVAHAGGPPLAVYLYPLRMARQTLAATTVVFFAAVNFAKILPYAALGTLTAQNLLTSLLLLPLAPIGIKLGVWLQGRMSDQMFYRVIYVLLGLTGVQLVWEGLGL
jgi:uncharacterized membrane protein YfcA